METKGINTKKSTQKKTKKRIFETSEKFLKVYRFALRLLFGYNQLQIAIVSKKKNIKILGGGGILL